MADAADKSNGPAGDGGLPQADPRRLLRGRVDDSPQGASRGRPSGRRGGGRRDRPARRRLCRGADLRRARGALGERRPAQPIPAGHLQARRLHARRGHRRGGQDHRLRAARQPEEPSRRERRRPTSRSRPAARTSAARCSFVDGRQQLHLSLPRRRLRLRGQGHRRAAGAPARPLPDPRQGRPGRRSALATASPRSSIRCAPATRASSRAASGSTSIPPRPRHPARRPSER